MNTDQLKTILAEYPLSRRLNVLVDGTPIWETSVVEVLTKLMSEAPEKSPPALLTIFGRDSCIIRERIDEGREPNHLGPQFNKWLEIDLR
jgi:hypothetical protein